MILALFRKDLISVHIYSLSTKRLMEWKDWLQKVDYDPTI